MTDPDRRHAPATLRNRDAILAVLRRVLPKDGLLLEIASGTGEHAAWIAPQLEGTMQWQPTDADAGGLSDIDGWAAESGTDRVRPALHLRTDDETWPVEQADAILCCNMIHIAPFAAAQGLFAGAAKLLGVGAPLILYGPFRRDGVHTAPSNEAFDESLRGRNPEWGVRCLETDLGPLAEKTGFLREEIVEMPANNLVVVFRRRG